MKKYIDSTWDFRTADTKTFTHCFHNYPAMMIPQVAGRLMDKYGKAGDLLLDPYCGTGTSLVESNLRGINAVGNDLNPLACLIAKTKTTVLNLQTLDLYLKDFNNFQFAKRFGCESKQIEIPDFPNIDFWFGENVKFDLGQIKYYISEITGSEIQNFFKVAFSETVRDCSLTRNSEFKLYRMTEEQRARFQPDVFGVMEAKLARNRRGLESFQSQKKSNAKTILVSVNSSGQDFSGKLPFQEFDLIVTSPPYGDSRTTVAYGQFSRLSNQWLGFANANQIDNLLMGGKQKTESLNFDSSALNQKIKQISAKDEKRAAEVASFYFDYRQSINNVASLIKAGGFACYVVGNRKVKGVTIPTDEITADFFTANGFSHLETIVRNIPNKRMPAKNSPTNVTGEKDVTMSQEFIVVLQKN